MMPRDDRLAAVLELLFARRFPNALRYGATPGLVAIFTALDVSVSPHDLRFILVLPAVLVASLCFGAKPGLLATALTTLAAIVAMFGTGPPPMGVAAAFLSLVAYAATGIGTALLCHLLRTTMRRALRAESAATLLVDDMAHRTKNDLQMVASVLTLQARNLTEPAARAALDGAAARIRAIAKLHNRLRSDGKAGIVDMHDYLDDLCNDLCSTYGELRPVVLNVEADHVLFASGVAASVGLIVNELVTNAFKYAFPHDASGVVTVTFRRGPDGFLLRIEDDGIGLRDAAEGLGSRLIRLLTRQIDGTLDKGDGARGTVAVITFPAP
jgi:two-component sensor histidine kinase